MEDLSFLDEDMRGVAPEHIKKSEKDKLKQQSAEWEYLIKNDSQFFCKRSGKNTQASLCLKHSKVETICKDCTFGQRVKQSNRPAPESPSLWQGTGNSSIIELNNFEEFNPRENSGSYVALRKDVLCISVAAIRRHNLEGFERAKLLYDKSSSIVGIRFLNKENKGNGNYLAVTRPKNGSMRISFMGFRSFYGIKVTGRFCILSYDGNKQVMFVDLKENFSV